MDAETQARARRFSLTQVWVERRITDIRREIAQRGVDAGTLVEICDRFERDLCGLLKARYDEGE
jgi:hypothetical protein